MIGKYRLCIRNLLSPHGKIAIYYEGVLAEIFLKKHTRFRHIYLAKTGVFIRLSLLVRMYSQLSYINI